MKKIYPAAVPHDIGVIEELRNDPKLAEEFLRMALAEAGDENGDYVLQQALRLVAEARGMGRVAKAAGIPRESLSRALSKRGNPRLSTLQAVTHALGLKLTVARV
ncbi:MAG: addiction module antidote protein [Rickettsiales bacterium]